MCLFHLSKSHPTADCNVKKECEKLLAEQKAKNSSATASTTGRLRHIQEDIFEDVLDDSLPEVEQEPNDTNDELLHYFARVTNHYLRLVRSQPSTSLPDRHTMQYPVIADSGANFHMFRELDFFTSLTPAKGQVILGDGTTCLPIHGIGTVTCLIGNHTLQINNVRYVPGLSESIYSLFSHIQSPGHSVHSSFEDGLYIIFPDFKVQAVLGDSDIYIDMIPIVGGNKHSSCTDHSPPTTDSFCRNFKQFTEDVTKETKYLDNLLVSLRNYYKEVKTKCQLNLNLPAGFRHDNTLCRQIREYHLDNNDISAAQHSSAPLPDLPSTLNNDIQLHPNTAPQETSPVHIPILRCVDKPSSSLPSRMTFTEDSIRASVGFRRIDTIKRHLKTLYRDTVSLDKLPPDAVLDIGDYATIPKAPRNTTPVTRPAGFADVIHMDIVFGPDIAVGNVHYGLIFTDRYSRMSYMYPLKNLTSDIIAQLDTFFAHLGLVPKRLVTDFDTKLIGGKSRAYLNQLKIHVNAAPTNHQDRNGLAERHWQTLTAMARNWLASAELPPSFLFYAVKRAAEVCNYFPLQTDSGQWILLLN